MGEREGRRTGWVREKEGGLGGWERKKADWVGEREGRRTGWVREKEGGPGGWESEQEKKSDSCTRVFGWRSRHKPLKSSSCCGLLKHVGPFQPSDASEIRDLPLARRPRWEAEDGRMRRRNRHLNNERRHETRGSFWHLSACLAPPPPPPPSSSLPSSHPFIFAVGPH